MQHKGVYTLHLGFLHIDNTHLLLNDKETLNITSFMLLNIRVQTDEIVSYIRLVQLVQQFK